MEYIAAYYVSAVSVSGHHKWPLLEEMIAWLLGAIKGGGLIVAAGGATIAFHNGFEGGAFGRKWENKEGLCMTYTSLRWIQMQ
jgi:hypothetical protein